MIFCFPSSLFLLFFWWDPLVYSLYTCGTPMGIFLMNISLAFTHQKKKKEKKVKHLETLNKFVALLPRHSLLWVETYKFE